ncbi:MAG: NAD(+) synthase [Rubrimonas sp.]|uniref:NAD(+) synthase n=1 Tax=Rubrimonas sp. TaxID=2036015 RepID=UPI002FDD1BEC
MPTLAPPPRFFNATAQGFARVAVATPAVRPADPAFNAAAIAGMARRAEAAGALLLLTPELGLSGYAIDDLLHQDALLDGVEAGLAALGSATRDLGVLLVVGAPLRVAGRLHNCALVLHRGRVLGAVPKSHLPNYREFYEARHFAPAGAAAAGADAVRIAGVEAPFGTDLLFEVEDVPGFTLALELCEDVWTPIPPSARAAMAGATVVANLSASNASVGKADYRHALCAVTSARQLCAYLYSAAGAGESTTDLAWDGQAMIYEAGALLAESERFALEPRIIPADVDLRLLQAERIRNSSFADCARANPPARAYRRVALRLSPDLERDAGLLRAVPRFPFVPDDAARRDALCAEAYQIQVDGLRQRIAATGVKRLVIGVSGGLDSTQALLVACQCMDLLGRPRTDVLAHSLPAFATSRRTRAQAHRLMAALGVTAREVDMTPACLQMLRDIGHPAANGAPQHDIAFENVQAGARTSFLFRVANHEGGMVLGTGDLSELALGWATYGVGDQMSHYNVNASAPKTLIQHLLRWVAEGGRFGAEASAAIRDILATEISPELVPGDAGADGPAQRTEDVVGPYALQDFNLFHITRYGMDPGRVAFLAWHAWRDAQAGRWPEGIAEADRRAYDLDEIARWLRVFLTRFFGSSQFKRSAMPNGPKISSGGALSPRGDWRAPSDGAPDLWLAALDAALGIDRRGGDDAADL